MDLEAQKQSVFKRVKDEGKPSVISSYCKNAQAAGAASCLWVCYEEHGNMRAKDVRLENGVEDLRLRDMAKTCGWWRRFAVYSVVDIQEVEIRFHHLSTDKRIFVFVNPVRHEILVEQKEKEIEELREMIEEGGVCGVTSEGKLHGINEPCPNAIRDEDFDSFCPVLRIYRRKCQCEMIRNAPALLRFYWSTKSMPLPISDLEDSGFVYKYKDLQTLRFYDALAPYGQSIKAFHLILGWSWQYIAALVAAGVCTSIFTAVLTALATHDLDCGWSAGSYTAAVVATLLSLLSALSRAV